MATSLEDSKPNSVAEPFKAAGLARWFAAAVTGLLPAVGITLTWRRIVGALENPLPWQAMLSVGILLSAAALAARRCAVGRISHPSDGTATDWKPVLPRLLTSVGVLSVGIALTMPPVSLSAATAFWVPVAAEELWAWSAGFRRIWPLALLGRSRRAAEEDVATRHPPPATRHPFHDVAGVAGEDVVQQQIRSRAADGTEVLCGWLRVPLAPGQRSASVHVAFCPPFPRTPEVAVQQREGPATRIKAVQLLPHGARFDLRLAQPSESAGSVLLEFSAQSEPSGLGSSEPDRSSPT